MFYPLYIHKEPGSAYGGTFPDFPGCFTAADDLNDLPAMAQEAVEVHFDGESIDVPAPSDPSQWTDHHDFQGGYWMLVDIDLARVNSKATRLNISLPAGLVDRIDRQADAEHMTRSGWLAKAASAALESEKDYPKRPEKDQKAPQVRRKRA